MGCTDRGSARSALVRGPKRVDELGNVIKIKGITVERRVRTLVLEEVDPVAPQGYRVRRRGQAH